MLNITNIPSARVLLVDDDKRVTRDWYRFLLNLFELTGGGKHSATLTLPTPIVVGTSPFTYTNTSGGPLEVVISGGGVSKLQLSRDNTLFYDTGSYYGMFTLAAGDELRVTYIAAPTMTAVTQ